MQRKMVKWKPFNTLLKYKDILDIERNGKSENIRK